MDEPGAGWLGRAADFSHTRREPRAEIPPGQRLLELAEAAYGPDHVEVAGTLTNLGAAWRDLGKPEKARDLFERALPIFERAYGPDHVRVAVTLDGLGDAWRNLGKPEKARDRCERALRILERAYGPDHVLVAGTLTNLGLACSDLGQPATARDLYVRALRIFCAHYPNGHRHRDLVVRNLRRVAPDLIVLDDGRVVSRSGDAPPINS